MRRPRVLKAVRVVCFGVVLGSTVALLLFSGLMASYARLAAGLSLLAGAGYLIGAIFDDF